MNQSLVNNEPEIVLPAPSETNPPPRLQEEIHPVSTPGSTENKAFVKRDRKRLLRHIHKILSHPVLKKRLEGYNDTDLSSFSDEELHDLILELEDTCLAQESTSILSHIIGTGIKSLEAYSITHSQFPLKIAGLSQELAVDNAESPLNIKLALIAASAESGIRLSPIQSLACQLLSTGFFIHHRNLAINHHQVVSKLEEKVSEDKEKTVDAL